MKLIFKVYEIKKKLNNFSFQPYKTDEMSLIKIISFCNNCIFSSFLLCEFLLNFQKQIHIFISIKSLNIPKNFTHCISKMSLTLTVHYLVEIPATSITVLYLWICPYVFYFIVCVLLIVGKLFDFDDGSLCIFVS